MSIASKYFPLVTRVEVIDASGRVFVADRYRPGVTISVQDEGRTLKVFAGEDEER